MIPNKLNKRNRASTDMTFWYLTVKTYQTFDRCTVYAFKFIPFFPGLFPGQKKIGNG